MPLKIDTNTELVLRPFLIQEFIFNFRALGGIFHSTFDKKFYLNKQ